MAVGRGGVVAALDIGTTKISCFIARVDSRGAIRVGGVGHHEAKGLRAGAIIDIDAAEESIRAAVDSAERLANETIEEVIVAFSGGYPASHTVGIEIGVHGRQVSDMDVARVLAEARAHVEPGDNEVVHAIPVGFSLDNTSGIKDPRSMFGSRLGVNLHVITAATGMLRNLDTCTERGHLSIQRRVLSSYAAGLACLVEDEMDLGVTVIDMGGGTTTIAVFAGGHLVFAGGVPVGGNHVTNDIARGLSTPKSHAERMKTLYGSTLPSPTDEKDIMEVPLIGEEDAANATHVPRSALTGIIQPRVEETLELVRDRLEAGGAAARAGQRVVLTGGASQLQGMREIAARILDKQVRLGRPMRISGLAEATAGPGFSACAGLLLYATRNQNEAIATEVPGDSGNRFARWGRWLKENF
ncbi:MAG: cell division protein FtsA [Proteobacteria bacterium]|nr:cell division protein FtsA [Pseudomonadota bacterium]